MKIGLERRKLQAQFNEFEREYLGLLKINLDAPKKFNVADSMRLLWCWCPKFDLFLSNTWVCIYQVSQRLAYSNPFGWDSMTVRFFESTRGPKLSKIYFFTQYFHVIKSRRRNRWHACAARCAAISQFLLASDLYLITYVFSSRFYTKIREKYAFYGQKTSLWRVKFIYLTNFFNENNKLFHSPG